MVIMSKFRIRPLLKADPIVEEDKIIDLSRERINQVFNDDFFVELVDYVNRIETIPINNEYIVPLTQRQVEFLTQIRGDYDGDQEISESGVARRRGERPPRRRRGENSPR